VCIRCCSRRLFPVRARESVSGRSGRELRRDRALQHGGRAGTAAAFATGLREHAGTVQPGSARLEGRHAAGHAVRQAQRTGHAAVDGRPHVGAAGHRNTGRARWTQLTTVSNIKHYRRLRPVLVRFVKSTRCFSYSVDINGYG